VLIDPFTVGAQIVNFLILVWLLRRLLYGPVTRAMAAREARIRAEIDDARRLREEAMADGERHRALIAGFDAERAAGLVAARAELDVWRHEQVQGVRSEVEAMRQRWQRVLQQEKSAFLRELRRRAGHEVLHVARQAMRDLADADLDRRMTARFLTQVQGLAPGDRDQIVAAAREDGHRLHIRTAYPMAGQDEQRLREAIAGALGPDLTPEFATAPELVGGVELRAGGFKVAWTIGDYLDALDSALAETFGTAPEVAGGRS
jgi:F-type H+-transporting ATPase subunit b